MIKYVIYWLFCEYKDNSWRIKDKKEESSIYGDVWGFKSNGRNMKKSFQRKLRQHGVYYGHDVEYVESAGPGGPIITVVCKTNHEPIMQAIPAGDQNIRIY